MSEHSTLGALVEETARTGTVDLAGVPLPLAAVAGPYAAGHCTRTRT